jgi:hypothetical protein
MAPVSWSFTTTGPVTCPCSIWGSGDTPANTITSGIPAEYGVKFQTDTDGSITAIRFYRTSSTSESHRVDLWSSTGTLLANRTASLSGTGWKQVDLATPVAIDANTTYVASFHTSGSFGYTEAYFATSGHSNGPLEALENGDDGPNGVYIHGGADSFPVNSWNASHYWVDVVFDPD